MLDSRRNCDIKYSLIAIIHMLTQATPVYILHLPEMKLHLDLDVLSTYLISEGCITMNDLSLLEVSVHQSKDRAIRNLAKLIQRGGQKGLLAFFRSLRRSTVDQPGHGELLRILEKAEEERERKESSSASADVLEPSDQIPLLPQTSTSSQPSSSLDASAADTSIVEPIPEDEPDFARNNLPGPLQPVDVHSSPEESLFLHQTSEAEVQTEEQVEVGYIRTQLVNFIHVKYL